MNKNSIGIIVDSLEHSQLALEIFNSIKKSRKKYDFTIFYLDNLPVKMMQQCASMHFFEAYTYRGVMIATSCATAQKMIELPLAQDKVFYVNSLEWVNNQPSQFEGWANIYQNESFKLSTKKDYVEPLENMFNVKVASVSNKFDVEEILCNLTLKPLSPSIIPALV